MTDTTREKTGAPPVTAAIVLCWNDADRVLRLLDRLAALDPPPDRVVVVDNGSTGADAARIEAAFPHHEIVRLPANAGFAAAANRGIGVALARGATEAWLLNSDIELPRGALLSLRRALRAAPRGGMAGAVFTTPGGRVECHGGGRVSLRTGACVHATTPHHRRDYLVAACLLIDARMLREIGSFDEEYFFYWEDVELGFRAREAGWTLAVADTCRVVHDEGSTLGKWSGERWEMLFRGMSRFMRSRSPLPAAAIAVRLAIHSATMLRHGRFDALAGAWRALRTTVRASPRAASRVDTTDVIFFGSARNEKRDG